MHPNAQSLLGKNEQSNISFGVFLKDSSTLLFEENCQIPK